MPTVSFRVDEEEKEALEAEARKRGISRSKYLKQLIQRRGQGDADREELQEKIERLERDLEEVTQQRDLAQHQLSVVTDTPVQTYVDEVNKSLKEFRHEFLNEIDEKTTNNSSDKHLKEQLQMKDVEIDRLEETIEDLKLHRNTAIQAREDRIEDLIDRIDWMDAQIHEMRKPRRKKAAEWFWTHWYKFWRYVSPF